MPSAVAATPPRAITPAATRRRWTWWSTYAGEEVTAGPGGGAGVNRRRTGSSCPAVQPRGSRGGTPSGRQRERANRPVPCGRLTDSLATSTPAEAEAGAHGVGDAPRDRIDDGAGDVGDGAHHRRRGRGDGGDGRGGQGRRERRCDVRRRRRRRRGRGR